MRRDETRPAAQLSAPGRGPIHSQRRRTIRHARGERARSPLVIGHRSSSDPVRWKKAGRARLGFYLGAFTFTTVYYTEYFYFIVGTARARQQRGTIQRA